MSTDFKVIGEISPEIIDNIKDMHRSNNFAALLGIEIAEIGEGFCRLRQKVDVKCSNPYGGIHGGVPATIIDIAMGIAIRALGIQPITAELTINYLGTALTGIEIIADGKITHRGSRLIIADGTVLAADGKIIARSRGLFMTR